MQWILFGHQIPDEASIQSEFICDNDSKVSVFLILCENSQLNFCFIFLIMEFDAFMSPMNFFFSVDSIE